MAICFSYVALKRERDAAKSVTILRPLSFQIDYCFVIFVLIDIISTTKSMFIQSSTYGNMCVKGTVTDNSIGERTPLSTPNIITYQSKSIIGSRVQCACVPPIPTRIICIRHVNPLILTVILFRIYRCIHYWRPQIGRPKSVLFKLRENSFRMFDAGQDQWRGALAANFWHVIICTCSRLTKL